MLLCAVSALAAASCSSPASGSHESAVIVVGSYASADEPGIKAYAFDLATGNADSLSALSGVSNPSYLVLSADASSIYSVGEDGGSTSTINRISFDRSTGAMRLEESIATGGGAPCYIALSPGESCVVTANYMGGSVSVAPLDSAGAFAGEARVTQFYGHGPDSARQASPHLHCAAFTPDGSRMLASDLGKDMVYVFGVSSGMPDVSPADSVALRPGSGPRHIVYSRDGRFAYLINEISGYVTVLDCGSDFAPVQYALCDSLGAQGSGDIRLSPDGRFLYASNRLKGDGIAIYAIDEPTGLIEQTAYAPTGSHPRNFAISPDGRFVLVACRDDNKIQVFRRDAATGLLEDTGADILTPQPVCVKFVES